MPSVSEELKSEGYAAVRGFYRRRRRRRLPAKWTGSTGRGSSTARPTATGTCCSRCSMTPKPNARCFRRILDGVDQPADGAHGAAAMNISRCSQPLSGPTSSRSRTRSTWKAPRGQNTTFYRFHPGRAVPRRQAEELLSFGQHGDHRTRDRSADRGERGAVRSSPGRRAAARRSLTLGRRDLLN